MLAASDNGFTNQGNHMAIDQATKERGIGVFLILLGAALSYAFIYAPYASMLAGEPEVSIGFKSSLFGPLAALLGIFYLALGERAADLFGRTTKPTWKTYVLVGVLVAISCLPYFWLDAQFTAHGYS